jgi:hypothetical protein
MCLTVRYCLIKIIITLCLFQYLDINNTSTSSVCKTLLFCLQVFFVKLPFFVRSLVIVPLFCLSCILKTNLDNLHHLKIDQKMYYINYHKVTWGACGPPPQGSRCRSPMSQFAIFFLDWRLKSASDDFLGAYISLCKFIDNQCVP